jgi:hypothetical protein
MEQRPKKLLEQLRDIMFKYSSYQRGNTYIDWIRRYILFHDQRHPGDVGSAEI